MNRTFTYAITEYIGWKSGRGARSYVEMTASVAAAGVESSYENVLVNTILTPCRCRSSSQA